MKKDIIIIVLVTLLLLSSFIATSTMLAINGLSLYSINVDIHTSKPTIKKPCYKMPNKANTLDNIIIKDANN